MRLFFLLSAIVVALVFSVVTYAASPGLGSKFVTVRARYSGTDSVLSLDTLQYVVVKRDLTVAGKSNVTEFAVTSHRGAPRSVYYHSETNGDLSILERSEHAPEDIWLAEPFHTQVASSRRNEVKLDSALERKLSEIGAIPDISYSVSETGIGGGELHIQGKVLSVERVIETTSMPNPFSPVMGINNTDTISYSPAIGFRITISSSVMGMTGITNSEREIINATMSSKKVDPRSRTSEWLISYELKQN